MFRGVPMVVGDSFRTTDANPTLGQPLVVSAQWFEGVSKWPSGRSRPYFAASIAPTSSKPMCSELVAYQKYVTEWPENASGLHCTVGWGGVKNFWNLPSWGPFWTSEKSLSDWFGWVSRSFSSSIGPISDPWDLWNILETPQDKSETTSKHPYLGQNGLTRALFGPNR